MTIQIKQLLVIIAIPLLASCMYWESSDQNIHNTNAGNVGIGTTTPASKLTVDGLIESKSGGIKFPDGSVQSSAAGSGLLPRNSISVRKKETILVSHQLFSGSVKCEADELVMGGGISTIDDNKLFIWRDAPSEDAKRWQYGVSNYGPSNRRVTVLAICVRVQ